MYRPHEFHNLELEVGPWYKTWLCRVHHVLFQNSTVPWYIIILHHTYIHIHIHTYMHVLHNHCFISIQEVVVIVMNHPSYCTSILAPLHFGKYSGTGTVRGGFLLQDSPAICCTQFTYTTTIQETLSLAK